MSGLAPEFDLLRADWPLLIATDTPARRTLNVTAAFDGERIAQVAVAGERHVQDALFAAFSMFRQKDRWLDVARRTSILQQFQRLLGEHAEVLTQQTARETGKPVAAMATELQRALETIDVAVAQLARDSTDKSPDGSGTIGKPQGAPETIAIDWFEPGGVVVAMLASEHPLERAARALVAAVAAGCPIILKPAEPAPLAALRLVHMLHEAGLPYVWAQCAVTEANDVAQQLAVDPRVALVSFSGNAAVGWSLRRQLPPGTRCVLDHGGVTPAIVAADADLTRAVDSVIAGAFSDFSPDVGRVQRVFVHSDQLADFSRRLVRCTQALNCGDPLQPDTQVGAMLDSESMAAIAQCVASAVGEGAELLSGNAAAIARETGTQSHSGNRLFPPAVLLNPSIAAQISTQPVFGPVLALYSYAELDDACHRANALPYGYSALVFTESEQTLRSVARQLDASLVLHNTHSAENTGSLALTGLRRSGLGSSGVLASMTAMRFCKYVLSGNAGSDE